MTEFFDVNGDGIPDLQLTAGVMTAYKSAYTGVSGAYQGYDAFGTVNKVVGYAGTFGNYATRLAAGTVVNASSAFIYGNYLTILGSRFSGKNYGQFRTRGYLGFEFAAADGEHFGYLNLLATVAGSTAANLSAKLTFYSAAYETTPGVAITIPGAVPEPSSLAALAFGGIGLAGCGGLPPQEDRPGGRLSVARAFVRIPALFRSRRSPSWRKPGFALPRARVLL